MQMSVQLELPSPVTEAYLTLLASGLTQGTLSCATAASHDSLGSFPSGDRAGHTWLHLHTGT